MDPYLGEIKLFAFPDAPRGWAQCNGQLLPINRNQALFALLGNKYGGDGSTTFAVPDLRGRTPAHVGPKTELAAQAINKRTTLRSADPTDATSRAGAVVLNFCIALQGIFPTRNW